MILTPLPVLLAKAKVVKVRRIRVKEKARESGILLAILRNLRKLNVFATCM